ncbi:MAG: serine hydrolase [Armatimonadota bacterium]|nr:serine hydrolase [Armatimonadota bacterium]
MIRRLAARFSGELGVWAHCLDTGESVEWNAYEIFPAASAIKLGILYEVYHQVFQGLVRLDDMLTVQAEDLVPGSGILKDLTPGMRLSVKDLATLMIVVSDNTAANLLIDLLGREAINQSFAELGLNSTRLEHKFFRAPKESPPNRSTPADLGKLMLRIATHTVLTPQLCTEMLDILGRQHLTDNLTRYIPDFDGFIEPGREPVVRVASKSGAIRGTRNEVGLVSTRSCSYVIAVMSKGCKDTRFYPDNEASRFVAKISAMFYEYFQTRAIQGG